ncbi:MAG TPA: serine hydrolase [Vicinamibacterales bacterium]|nr:serine hydrolase [Vicinamibacterales bacterium]
MRGGIDDRDVDGMRAVDTVIACAVTAGQLDDVHVRAIDRRLATSTPDGEGLDAAILGELVGRIRSGTYGNVDSLLVVRHEKLVVEEYFGGRSASDVHTLQSVSKSVTSLLTGLAIERGRLRLDDRVVERFPQYAPIANMDDRKPRLTVRDLRHGGTRRNTEEHGLTRIRMTRTR